MSASTKTPKFEDLDALEAVLLKARRRLSDEVGEDEEDVSPEEAGMREFDPDEESGDDADKWLEANDPEQGQDEENEDEYDEYGPDEDEESHQQEPELDEEQVGEPDELGEEPSGEVETSEPGETDPEAEGDSNQVAQPQEEEPAKEEVSGEGRFPQPSKEELNEMRQYSRPWEQNAREKQRLDAEAQKNPVLAHQGKMIEARNAGHKSQQEAYAEFQASPEYQKADPVTQMEMDSNFESDFHKKNPDYLANAAKLHGQAHVEGLQGMGEGYNRKKEDIQHIRGGGASPEMPMSVEEGMQHAGGSKGEEGTTGSMVQDPASAFANQHKKFLDEMGGEHESKAGSRQQFYGNKASEYAKKLGGEEGVDLKSLIGKHGPDVADRFKRIDSFKSIHGKAQEQNAKSKTDQFFEKYHPLISMHAHKVLNKLGLDKKNVDLGALHEAGMHGLFQAMNDYEHDNPSKASFATHAGNKINGLMHTAMRNQMQTPNQLTTEAKKFQHKEQAPVPKVTTPKPEGGNNE